MNFSFVSIAPDGCGLYPFRPVWRAAFFVEETSIHAFRITLQRQRTILQMRQQDGRDADVIINDLRFGEGDLGIKDLVEIGNGNLAAADVQSLRRASRGGCAPVGGMSLRATNAHNSSRSLRFPRGIR